MSEFSYVLNELTLCSYLTRRILDWILLNIRFLAVSRAPVHPKGSPICFAGLVRQQIEQSFHSKARWEANKLFEKP